MGKEKRGLTEKRERLVSAKRIGRPCISLDAMDAGKDEMNLVEFPLAGLSARSPAGQSSLVFEDSIWDRSRGQEMHRRLTITGSAEYKLPTPLDDDVILGLIQLSRAQRFQSRQVSFRPVELIRLLGWRPEGRSYDRLEKSLRRWLAVTLYYDNAWWDIVRKAWVDEHFHLIDHVIIRRRARRVGSAERRIAHTATWSIVWNEVVFRSFQAGYLRPLDMKLYRELKSPAAKRMYRFLDKRFYRSNHLEFDLRLFACEHIGFARAYDNGQLKRRLKPAVAELENAGYLEPLSSGERFLKVCHGTWKIRLVRGQSVRRGHKRNSRWHVLERALVDRNVTPAVATRLVREYPHRVIREKVAAFDQLRTASAGFELRNPPGFLVRSIQRSSICEVKENPQSTTTVGQRHRSARARSTHGCEKERSEEQLEDDDDRKAIEEYLAKLSAEEIEKLEAEALQHANPFLSKGYERSSRGDNTRLSQEYLAMILHAHVRSVIGLQAESH